MTRRYAYSLGGSRTVDSAPLSKPKNTTILSSIQLDGTLRYTTFSGGTTVERFKRYLETDLLPHLNGNSVLIMDNMKSHHAKAVKNLLDSSEIRYISLPPYSPDLNLLFFALPKKNSFCRLPTIGECSASCAGQNLLHLCRATYIHPWYHHTFVPISYSKPAQKSTFALWQHRTIPALRLKHRSGGCGTASALPKCSIIHPVLSALLAWHLPHLARRIGT